MEVQHISILDIQPSQFYISEEKMAKIKQWFNPEDLSNFNPVPIKLLDGKVVFTDGHTRALVAFNAGLTEIPLVWDEDDLDWESYKLCVKACKQRGISSIADLSSRVLSAREYSLKWDIWCDVLHEVLELQGGDIR